MTEEGQARKKRFDTPEKRMRMFRLLFVISEIMVVFGFIIIIFALFWPGLIP